MSGRLKRGTPLRDRFDHFAIKQQGCWPWTGPVDRHGYGRVQMNGKSVGAYRVAWLLFRGEIPSGLHVLHNCNNPNCCNPDHLRLGTHAENMRDMAASGIGRRPRFKRDGRPSAAKLSASDVIEIRQRLSAGERRADLAAEFGVTPSNISHISRNKSWRAAAAESVQEA